MKIKNHRWKQDVTGWLIMLPALILFAFFIWEPLFESVRLSLFAAKGYHTTDFVGLDNYIGLFANPDFAIAWKNTSLYVLCSLVIGFVVPIFMAAIITESPFLRGITRVSVYMPNILPGLAVVLIWKFSLQRRRYRCAEYPAENRWANSSPRFPDKSTSRSTG